MTEFWLDFWLPFWIIVVGSVCAVSCALLGCFLVLKRMSLLCDAIGHGMLPGIALGVLLTGRLDPGAILVGAMIFGILTAVLAQTLNSFGKVAEDAALGVVFTALFAIGIILLSAPGSKQPHVDASCVFMAHIENVPHERWLGLPIPLAFPTMLLSLVVTVSFITLLGKELRIAAFDPALATAMGFNAVFLHYLLIALVAASTVTSFQAVGSVVVLAMFIVPAATAQLFAERLRTMLLVAAAVAVVSAVGGYFAASAIGDANISGMMASVAGLQLLLAVLFAPRHGILAKVMRNYQLTLRIAGEEALAALFRAEEKQQTIAALQFADHGFSRLTIWLAVGRLVRKGFMRRQAESWQLTDKGRHEAASVVRAHRLWEAFLGQNFELPLDHLHAPATRIEHFIGPELQSKLAKELHEPAIDPHGKAIPPA